MPRITRLPVAVALALVPAAGWLMGGPGKAQAQAPANDQALSRYQLSVLESASQPRQPQWVILDTRTGAMELWLPGNGGFDVTRLQFAGATGATRHVATPEPGK